MVCLAADVLVLLTADVRTAHSRRTACRSGHTDALKSKTNKKRLEQALQKSYEKGFPLACRSSRECFRYDVKVIAGRSCGWHEITVNLRAIRSCAKTSCTLCKKKQQCETPFAGGCMNLARVEKVGQNVPRKAFHGKCNKASARVTITKSRNGSLRSMVTVTPGGKHEPVSSRWSNIVGNIANALLLRSVRETNQDKLARVCNKLRTVDEALMREGIANSHFELEQVSSGYS